MADTMQELEVVQHWIGGEPVEGDSGRQPVTEPATGDVIREVALADLATVDAAVAAAEAAADGWGETPMAKRVTVLQKLGTLVREHEEEFVDMMGSEHGKVRLDALGELQRGLEVLEMACGAQMLTKGEYSDQAATDIDVYSMRRPLGVCVGITPFNFPIMIPLWLSSTAIACGNTFVLKPSEQDPSCSVLLGKLWKEAGLPDGVFNVVQGDKTAVDGLLDHPDVQAVSFIGSTPIAKHVYERGTASGKRVQAFGGAKNHMVVLPDSDIGVAADAAVSAAYGSSGQRCMAISALVTVGDVADDLIPAMQERIAKLRTGPASQQDADLGPVVSDTARDRIRAAIDRAESEGAKIVVDGRPFEGPDSDGYYVGPTLIDGVETGMDAYTQEIFGPVLVVLRVDTLEDAIAMLNANPYGNGAAVFTSSGLAARTFERKVTAGMIGVNVPIPVPVAAHSFGGWKASRFGDQHMSGPEAFRFYTKAKVVTKRWPSSGSGVDLAFGSSAVS